MKNITEIQDALSSAGPGTIILIRGYVNSNGDKRDMEVELLSRGAYSGLLKEDLRLLREADLSKVVSGEVGDLQLSDLLTARAQLIDSRSNLSASTSESAFVSVGPSIAKHLSEPDALYIRGSKLLGDDLPSPKPAKGAIPRAKQQLVALLDLPTRRYQHNLKLADGKFEDLQIYEKHSTPDEEEPDPA